MRRQTTPMHSVTNATGKRDSTGFPRDIALRLLRPSDRAEDPAHPVGSIAIAIRRALPHFQVWSLDTGAAATRFFSLTDEYQDRLRVMLPPGFAEGRPGAFVRSTRGLLVLNDNGSVQSVYEHLQASRDEIAFKSARHQMRMSDVLDVTWMATGVVELRDVHELLERVISAVLPSTQARFSSYDEPRYRAALQVHLDDVAARAACGGVVNEWSGRAAGVDVAHVRIFLEPWATFERIPEPFVS